MTNPFRPFIEHHGAAVLDGGLATELEARGVSLDHPLWSARALVVTPEAVAAVHRDYLEAGADVIETATYQARAPELLLDGVARAVRERDAFARRRPALVAASIGSYGASLANGAEYRGDYDLDAAALAAWHRPRLRVLETAGADVLAFETIPSLAEAKAIAGLLSETEGPPAWISFQARDEGRLADGSPIEEAIAAMESVDRIVAAGVNCVAPALVAPLLRKCAQATRKMLVAYPNRGDSWDAASRRWIPRHAHVAWERLVPEWRLAGARIIGGCCGTTPADVRSIRGTGPFFF